MKKLLVFVFAALACTACEDDAPQNSNKPNLRELSADEARLAQSGNNFAFNLFRVLQSEEQPNAFVSPFSVSLALGMTLNGANDTVRESILSVIDFEGLSAAELNQSYKDLTELLLSMDNKTTLGIANSIWSAEQLTLQKTFVDIIKTDYHGIAQGLDFSDPHSKDIINNWVEDKTNNKIKDLLDDLSADEVLYLINAIYFKSDWKYQFNKSATRKALFTNVSGTTDEVDMMYTDEAHVNYYHDQQVECVDIPYGNGQFSMVVLIPEGNLNDFVNQLSAEQLHQWFEASQEVPAELSLPKFKMKWKRDIKTDLQTLGLQTAGFPHFFEEQLNLAISKVIHQSFIEVNEEGSEAAAATAVGIEFTSINTPQRITVNRPFLFLIREKHSGVILFMGQLAEVDFLEQ